MTYIRRIFKLPERAAVLVLVAMVAVLSTAGMVVAQEMSFSARIGSLGLGGEASLALKNRIGVRAGFGLLVLSFKSNEEDIDYDVDIDLKTASIKGDVYLAHSGFRVSAGLVANSNEIRFMGRGQGELDIGNHTYAADDVGSLKARLDFEKTSPVLTIGIDSSLGKDHGFGFVFEVGAMFQNAPRVTLTADGPISDDPDFQADLKIERDQLDDDFGFFQIYPVLAVGVTYHL
ncbi:MAG: hypothetical protein WBW88_00895 [Rhodothermales bacterium]